MSGLTFKGLHSSQFNLILKSDNRQALSDVQRVTKSVPLYHGSIDFGIDTYGEKQISVIMQYIYKDMIDLMNQAEQISGWLYDDGKYYELIFDDQPNRKYYAKMASKLDVKLPNAVMALDVIFTCNPPYAFALDNTPVSPADVQERLLWDTALLEGSTYIQEFTSNGNMRFTVGGILPVKPVIILIGSFSAGFTLSLSGQNWRFTQALSWDSINIDCDKQTVTKGSDGSNQFIYVDPTKDDYFILQPGQNLMSVSGIIGDFPNSLNISVEFTPIYAG